MANLWRKQVAMWFPMMHLMAVDIHADGEQFGRIIWVFVEAEKVGVAEVRVDGMGKLICEDDIEEELEVCVDGWVVQADQTVEGIY